VLSGSTLPVTLGFLWRRLKRDRKADAETRKLNVETDGLIVTRLYAEIERLDRDLGEIRNELVTVRNAAIDEKNPTRNREQAAAVRSVVAAQVASLSWKRLSYQDGPEDMLAQLNAIDRKTGGGQ
jgi:hypothetical protein